MIVLNEHTGNERLVKGGPAPGNTAEQIQELLDTFDVLPSRPDRATFKYIYAYLIVLYLLQNLLANAPSFAATVHSLGLPLASVLLLHGVAFTLVPLLATAIYIWRFQVWRSKAAATLGDLLVNRIVSVPNGDPDEGYLRFLQDYRSALRDPRRYVLSVVMVTTAAVLYVNVILQTATSHSDDRAVLVAETLVNAVLYLGALHCIGVMTSAMYVSSRYVRRLLREFQIEIRPFHPDECGGLAALGSFCFRLFSPLLIASALLMGFVFFAVLNYPASQNGSVYLLNNVLLPIAAILLYGLPVSVLVFMLPLRDIHRAMVRAARANEQVHFARTEALRERIRSLLDSRQAEAASAVLGERVLVDALYAPYPKWPVRLGRRIFSTTLGVGASLLLGLTTGALAQYLGQYLVPAILRPVFHSP